MENNRELFDITPIINVKNKYFKWITALLAQLQAYGEL